MWPIWAFSHQPSPLRQEGSFRKHNAELFDQRTGVTVGSCHVGLMGSSHRRFTDQTEFKVHGRSLQVP